jgi:hypothetical protein
LTSRPLIWQLAAVWRKRSSKVVVICVAALIIAAIVWASQNKRVANFPNGERLALIDVTYGTNAQPVPLSNPLKRSWNKLAYLVKGQSYFITNQLPYVQSTNPDTAVFWFRKEQVDNTHSNIPWIAVREITNKLDPVSATYGGTFTPQTDIVGVIWQHCPTNKETLLLSFYRKPPRRKALPSDLDASNLLSQVSLINPAYRK